MVLPLVGMALVAGSAAIGAFGKVQQGKNAKKQANQVADSQIEEAKNIDEQANIQEQNAERIKISATRIANNAKDTLQQTARALRANRGEMRKAYAKSGVTNTGSALLTVETQLEEDQMKLFNIGDNAMFDIEQTLFQAEQEKRQAGITRRQAQQTRTQAGYTRTAGKDAYKSSLWSAGGDLIGTAGNMMGSGMFAK
jgi:hypothetical protein